MILSRAAPVLLIAALAGCDAQRLTAPSAAVSPESNVSASADSTSELRVSLAAATDDAVGRLLPALGDASETRELATTLDVLATSLTRSSNVSVAVALAHADVALARLEDATVDDQGRMANLAAIRLVLGRISTVLPTE